MVTPIDAVRFYSSFGDAEYWPRTEPRSDPSERGEEGDLAAARGALLGLFLGGLLWGGLIAGFHAFLGL
jgi:hypothetical protein